MLFLREVVNRICSFELWWWEILLASIISLFEVRIIYARVMSYLLGFPRKNFWILWPRKKKKYKNKDGQLLRFMPRSSWVPWRQINTILPANELVERNTVDCKLSRLTSDSLVLLLLLSREAICLKSYTMGTTVKSKRKRIPLLYFRNDL